MPTLLIVDEKPSAERFKEILEEQGFTCWTASKAADAARLLAQQKPDLLLLDPHLELDRTFYAEHLELIQAAKRASPATKVCVLCADPGTDSQAKASGADACFDKVSSFIDVIQTLKALSGQKA